MEIFLTVLRYAGAMILGALIGYLTNWLAVRMLFRPYYAKRIGKWRLPFTPGIIPKRKPALAKAIGEAVGEQLFTKDDLINSLVSDTAKDNICDYALSVWREAGELTAEEIAQKFTSEENVRLLKEKAEQFLGDKIYAAVQRVGIGDVVAREGAKAVSEKKASLGMLAMFLSDDLIASLAGKLGEGVNRYMEKNGRSLVSDAVKTELEQTVQTPLSSLTQSVAEDAVRSVARSLYEGAVKSAFAELAESVDVSAIVEEKLNAMDVKELEKLVLSVMKKELNAIVNLGALIGFVLGAIMIFI